MTACITRHCLITGRVQGVFYRQSTKAQAKKLGLTGWVRNLPDGRVEAVVSGPEPQVAQLIAWMQHGPKAARVDSVQVTELVAEKSYKEFSIKF